MSRALIAGSCVRARMCAPSKPDWVERRLDDLGSSIFFGCGPHVAEYGIRIGFQMPFVFGDDSGAHDLQRIYRECGLNLKA